MELSRIPVTVVDPVKPRALTGMSELTGVFLKDINKGVSHARRETQSFKLEADRFPLAVP